MTKLQHKKFMKRTYQLHRDHTRFFRKECGGSSAEAFALGFLRLMAEKCLAHGHDCPYCGIRLTITNLSLDHKVPRSRALEFAATLIATCALTLGNVTESKRVMLLAYAWDNCCWCCKRCNRRKGELTDVEFKMLLSLVTTFPTAASSYIFRKLSARLPFFRKDKA
jgi:5-methylcytosine-specific restriction endonuclease McrA